MPNTRNPRDAALFDVVPVTVPVRVANQLSEVTDITSDDTVDALDAELSRAAWFSQRGATVQDVGETAVIRLPRSDVEKLAERNTLRRSREAVNGPYSPAAGFTPQRKKLLEAFPYGDSATTVARGGVLRRAAQRARAADDVHLYRTDPDAYNKKRLRDLESGIPEVFEVAAARTLSGEDPDALADLDLMRTHSGRWNPNTPFTRDEAAVLERACSQSGASLADTGVQGLLPSTEVQEHVRRSDVEETIAGVQRARNRGLCSDEDAVDRIMRSINCDAAEEHQISEHLYQCLENPETPDERRERLARDPHSVSPTSVLSAVLGTPMVDDLGRPNPAANRINPDGSPIAVRGDLTVPTDNGESRAERQPGWGTVKADDDFLYRKNPDTGAWQRRPRGSALSRLKVPKGARWVATGPPGTRAVDVAPSVAADMLGGRCVACGRELKDAARHGGYGPTCVTKA